MKHLKAFLLLIRVPNLFIIFLTQLFSIHFLSSKISFDGHSIALMASTLLIAAGGNIINDYFDVRIDNINKPHEVWVGRLFSRRTILIMYLSLNLIGFLLALYVSWKFLVLVVLCSVLLWFYSKSFKCIPFLGNFVVALLTGTTILSISLTYSIYNIYFLAIASFSFLINLIREVTKDIEDIKGDRMFDCNTLPSILGIAITKKILLALETLFIVLISISIYFAQSYLKVYMVAVLLPLSTILIYKTILAHKKNHFRILSRIEKLLILLGVIAISVVHL